jgi:hypothetical protein
MKKEEATPKQEEAIPTLEEYEAALAALEKMKDGGELHAFAAHMHTALSYDLAHGIRPNAWERFG